MKYLVREMQPQEYPLLEEFLYEVIFQRDENNLLPKTIINDPALQVYIKDFGTMNDDYCLCAEINKKIVGAVWVRIIAGYGNLDDKTPEFAISLYKNYRGYGILHHIQLTMPFGGLIWQMSMMGKMQKSDTCFQMNTGQRELQQRQ